MVHGMSVLRWIQAFHARGVGTSGLCHQFFLALCPLYFLHHMGLYKTGARSKILTMTLRPIHVKATASHSHVPDFCIF